MAVVLDGKRAGEEELKVVGDAVGGLAGEQAGELVGGLAVIGELVKEAVVAAAATAGLINGESDPG